VLRAGTVEVLGTKMKLFDASFCKHEETLKDTLVFHYIKKQHHQVVAQIRNENGVKTKLYFKSTTPTPAPQAQAQAQRGGRRRGRGKGQGNVPQPSMWGRGGK